MDEEILQLCERLRNRPADAGEWHCYRCGQLIADAEYLVEEDALVRHFACPQEPQ